jgi:hypothetical protein
MLGCGNSGLRAARSGLGLGHRRFEALDFLTAIGKSRSRNQQHDGAGSQEANGHVSLLLILSWFR